MLKNLLPSLLLALTLSAQANWEVAPSAPVAVTTPPDAGIPDEVLTPQEIRHPAPVAGTIDLTAPTDDIWVRIRRGFSMPNLNDEVVLAHQQWYLNRPDYLRRMVERSRPYLYFIVEELEKRGMPMELAFLPMVESSFNPMAYSKAQASGLWQFIPATGKRYDLAQNWWHDQRRDVVASTGAALDYLQEIYEMNGDWHLALASYNWGENAVKRAVQKNLAKGLPTDFSSLTMPEETRNYVPKLQALKNIFGNARVTASFGLPFVPNRPYLATIEPGRAIDVAIAAKLAEMPLEEFRSLNPAHNRPLISPDMPVVLPADRLQTFQNNLEKHSTPLATWRLYTLRAGERLEKVAPRFGITLEDLKRVNGLHGRIRVAAGSSVLVPAEQGKELRVLPNDIQLPEIVQTKPAKNVREARRGAHPASKSKQQVKPTPTRGSTAKAKAPVKKAGTAKPMKTAPKRSKRP